jgi:glycosyltransferase involved in cell wall biosynthesis
MITLALTNFNRYNLLLESFHQVLADERISEIVISDDASDTQIFSQIVQHFRVVEKVKVFRNVTNQGVYRNKYHSVLVASNPWVIVFDSDNVIAPDYIEQLLVLQPWDQQTVYCPEFARPGFDYTHFSGQVITRENVASFYNQRRFDCLINTMNCFVNRFEFLAVFDPHTEPVAADSAYFNYRWLEAGNRMYVVPGLQYDHLIHKGSHYVNNSAKSNAFHADLMNKFKNMR